MEKTYQDGLGEGRTKARKDIKAWFDKRETNATINKQYFTASLYASIGQRVESSPPPPMSTRRLDGSHEEGLDDGYAQVIEEIYDYVRQESHIAAQALNVFKQQKLQHIARELRDAFPSD